MADKNKSGDFYNRPEKQGAWDGFSSFMWNSGTKQFMGRTSSSWGKILLFYLIFYAVLAAFFMAMWFIFASTLLEGRPKYELGESIIGQNPGLGFRPMPPESNVESTLIWYQKNNPNNSKYWVDEISSFLKGFPDSESTVDCRRKSPTDKQSCGVDLNAFESCAAWNNFGYTEGKPCIFLKLNKIFNWKPEYYAKGEKLPVKMPSSLRQHIESRSKENLEVVWVSCEGENPADIENLGNGTSYKSLNGEQGFLGKYFPFKNTADYLQPLVAVQFTTITPGVLINIECKAWARNIKHDRQDRRGSVHFELMIDEAPVSKDKN